VEDPVAPEIVELVGGAARLGAGRSARWIAGWIAATTVVVTVALAGAPPPDPAEPPDSTGQPSVAAIEPGRESGVPERSLPAGSRPDVPDRSGIVLAMPVADDVVVGWSIPLAGTVAGIGPEHGVARPASVTVEVELAGTIIGRADLAVLGGRFSGWVEVRSPSKVSGVELHVLDPRHSGRQMLVVPLLLVAPDGSAEAGGGGG
jgi:hypothetical protein